MKKVRMTDAEKKQDAKYREEKAAYNKKVLNMDFEQFKKAFIKDMDVTEKMILETITWNAKQRDALVKVLRKEIKKINKEFDIIASNFKTLDKRVRDLEVFTVIMAIKTKESLMRRRLTHEERKGIASVVSIKWDKSNDEFIDKAAA